MGKRERPTTQQRVNNFSTIVFMSSEGEEGKIERGAAYPRFSCIVRWSRLRKGADESLQKSRGEKGKFRPWGSSRTRERNKLRSRTIGESPQ